MKLRFKEIACAVLAALFVVILMRSAPESGKTAKDVFEAVRNSVDISMLAECDSARFKKEIGVSAEDFAEVVFYASESIMEVREIIVIKLKDSRQYDVLKETLEKRAEEKIRLFEGYAPKQCAQLKGYVLSRKADMVLFAVCDSGEKAVEAFRKAV